MRFSISILFLPMLVLVGCGKQSNPSATNTNAPATSGGSALTAPVDHLKTAMKEHQNMVKTVDTTALNKAIEMFQVQEGRLPKDLPELVAKKYIPNIPEPPAGSRIVYNATKGTVSIEKQ